MSESETIKAIINLIINLESNGFGDLEVSEYKLDELRMGYADLRDWVTKYPDVFSLYGIHIDGKHYIKYNGKNVWLDND